MLAIPQSQLPSLASAALQIAPASQPPSKGLGFPQQQQQQQARAAPIITPSLGPSTQLLFTPGTLPGPVLAGLQRQLQPPVAAEDIEIIGLDDDDEDDEEVGSEEESEGQLPTENGLEFLQR